MHTAQALGRQYGNHPTIILKRKIALISLFFFSPDNQTIWGQRDVLLHR
jgi:hypothetical protein